MVSTPSIKVTLEEAGLRGDIRNLVSGTRLPQSNGTRHRLLGDDVTEPVSTVTI